MGVSPMLLFIFIFISGVVAKKDHRVEGCDWYSTFWIFCGSPDCPDGTKEIGRQASGKSEIATFGEACIQGHRVLCCKSHLVKADPKEHCHLFTSIDWKNTCQWGKETIATEAKTINVAQKHFAMLCCDPEVLGAEKQDD